MHVANETPRDRRRRIVGDNIKQARRAAGLSQQRLALQLDMERADVWRWENGRHEPSPSNLERLALLLDRPYGWFFDAHEDSAA